jgi:hypothetical protein
MHVGKTFTSIQKELFISHVKLDFRDPCIVIIVYRVIHDRLCGLVVKVPVYRSRGPAFDSRRCQIFWEVLGLERGPLSLVRIIDELFEWKSSGSGLENWD